MLLKRLWMTKGEGPWVGGAASLAALRFALQRQNKPVPDGLGDWSHTASVLFKAITITQHRHIKSIPTTQQRPEEHAIPVPRARTWGTRPWRGHGAGVARAVRMFRLRVAWARRGRAALVGPGVAKTERKKSASGARQGWWLGKTAEGGEGYVCGLSSLLRKAKRERHPNAGNRSSSSTTSGHRRLNNKRTCVITKGGRGRPRPAPSPGRVPARTPDPAQQMQRRAGRHCAARAAAPSARGRGAPPEP
eukprot:gene5740-biopygen16285